MIDIHSAGVCAFSIFILVRLYRSTHSLTILILHNDYLSSCYFYILKEKIKKYFALIGFEMNSTEAAIVPSCCTVQHFTVKASSVD